MRDPQSAAGEEPRTAPAAEDQSEHAMPRTDYPVPGAAPKANPGAQGVGSFLGLQLKIFPIVAILALLFSVVIIYLAITTR